MWYKIYIYIISPLIGLQVSLTIVTLTITLVTKSHDPLNSRPLLRTLRNRNSKSLGFYIRADVSYLNPKP